MALRPKAGEWEHSTHKEACSCNFNSHLCNLVPRAEAFAKRKHREEGLVMCDYVMKFQVDTCVVGKFREAVQSQSPCLSKNQWRYYGGGGGGGGGHTPPQAAQGGICPGWGAGTMLCSRDLHGHS